MPLYDFTCPKCGERLIDEYIHNTKIMEHVQKCPMCDRDMELDQGRVSRDLFVPYIAEHLSRLEGHPVLIDSVGKLRKLEAKHQDQQLCCEPYSYDTKEGKESYEPPPNALEGYKTDLTELLRRGRR